MKKTLAIVLALIMAFSYGVLAFAEGESLSSQTSAKSNTNVCPYCKNEFDSESAFNDHIKLCYDQNNKLNSDFTNLSASDILERLVDFFKDNAGWWSTIQTLVVRLIDLIENIGTAAAGKADVAGAIDELEAKINSLPIIGDALEYIHSLLNTLRQKIKDLYSNVAETGAVAPVDTGSDASIGIAAFAAVSVAAAAAFVCTKKKED